MSLLAPPRVTKGARHRLCALRADPGDLGELGRRRFGDCTNRLESFEQGMSDHRRDSWNRRQNTFSGVTIVSPFRPLGPGRTVARLWILTSHGEAIEPQRGVALMHAPDDRHALFERRETGSAYRVLRQWSAIDMSPLEQNEWFSARRAQDTDLSPVPPLNDRDMQVEHALAFDACSPPDDVIAAAKPRDSHGRAELLEQRRNAAPDLVNISDDVHARHGPSVLTRSQSSPIAVSQK